MLPPATEHVTHAQVQPGGCDRHASDFCCWEPSPGDCDCPGLPEQDAASREQAKIIALHEFDFAQGDRAH